MKSFNTYIYEKLTINKDYNFDKNDKLRFSTSEELEKLNDTDAKLLDNTVKRLLKTISGLRKDSLEETKNGIAKNLKQNRVSQKKIDKFNEFFDSFDYDTSVFWWASTVNDDLQQFIMDNGIELFQILPYKHYGSTVVYACSGNEWTVCFYGLGDNCNLNSVSTIVIHN